MTTARLRLIGGLLIIAFSIFQPLGTAAARQMPGHEKKEVKENRVEEDINIRGVDPKRLEFNVVLPATTPPNTKILYDRAVEGDMCFISCNFYNGVTSKWSDFFVYVQPFENFCMALTGCSSQYPAPSDQITIGVGAKRYQLAIADRGTNSYYLPLDLRREIVENSTASLSVEISGVKMPIYRIGKSNVAKIATILNIERQLDEYLDQARPSKESRIKELDDLRSKGLITEEELNESRMKILAE